MNAEQKQQYEIDKLKKENEDLKKAQARTELEKTAAGILQEKDLEATQEVLDFVVGDDAETTNANIDKFVKIVEAQVKKAEIARATGTTPRNITNNGNNLSEIDKRIAKYS
jgi:hydrogenase maturation factor HypF (carbamoyltransferase family)